MAQVFGTVWVGRVFACVHADLGRLATEPAVGEVVGSQERPVVEHVDVVRSALLIDG